MGDDYNSSLVMQLMMQWLETPGFNLYNYYECYLMFFFTNIFFVRNKLIAKHTLITHTN